MESKLVPTLRDFAQRFRDAIALQCAAKPRTIQFYNEKLERLLEHEDFANARLDQIDEAGIDKYKQSRSKHTSRLKELLSPGTINRELATLRRLLRLAQEWNEIQRVPRVRLLRGERNREFVLSRDQEGIYLASIGPLLKDVASVLLETGLRQGELLSLQWEQVHLAAANGAKFGYLTVLSGKAKSGKSRNIPLTQNAVEVFRRGGPRTRDWCFIEQMDCR